MAGSVPADQDLFPEEARVLHHLRAHCPELAERFLAHLGAGRRAILHRLLMAALRENLARVAARATWPNPETLHIGITATRFLRIAGCRRLPLNRFQFGGELLLVDTGREIPVVHACELLQLLRPGLEVADAEASQRFERFAQELDNSTANYALGLVGAERRRQTIAGAAAPTSLEWVRHRMREDAAFSPLVFYEQWVIDGHPLHPGAKIKMGMEPADVMRHAPEWGARPGLALVAVLRDACRVVTAGPDRPTELLLREHPGIEAGVRSQLDRHGLTPAEVELIPVHPWQLEHTLPRLHADPLRRGTILPLAGVSIPAAALMSFRTLAPTQQRGEGKHQVKTAVDVQTTGAVRTVSPNAAENGPAISRILDAIDHREPSLGRCFVVLRERLGVYFRPTDTEGTPEERAAQSRHLAAIFREDPEGHTGPGEIAMPASALIADSPVGAGPIVGELVGEFALARGSTDAAQSAGRFLRRYLEITVPGFLTLMTRYGVGLEGHLQNSIAVFRGGEPVRLLVRDFGGVRILRQRLLRQGLDADFYPDSATVTDDVDDLRNKVFYAVVQNHLGELLGALARWAKIDEARLWAEVADVARTVFTGLRADPLIADQARADEAALFQPTLALKALTTMRLRGEVTRYTFAEVPNPLAGNY